MTSINFPPRDRRPFATRTGTAIHSAIRTGTRTAIRAYRALIQGVVAGLAICAAVMLPAFAHAQAQPKDAPQRLQAVTLTAGMFNIRAEVAQTPAQRQIGLMHRESMPLNDGMLFVFEEPSPQCFWMKNTLLPLSIAFLGDDGSIVNIADMKPMDETSHCSAKPVRYALEMNQGWFAKRGLKAGAKIGGGGFKR